MAIRDLVQKFINTSDQTDGPLDMKVSTLERWKIEANRKAEELKTLAGYMGNMEPKEITRPSVYDDPETMDDISALSISYMGQMPKDDKPTR